MKVGIEAKRFFNNFTGLGNYSRFIVDALSVAATDSEFYLFSPRTRSHPEIDYLVARENVHVVAPTAIYRLPLMKSLWRSWGMSADPHMKRIDIFHGLSQELPMGLPSKIKKIVTVHDLIFLRFPQYYNPLDVKIYRAKVNAACYDADKIIAISQQTADDLIHFLSVDPAKIQVVYQGSHPIFRKQLPPDQINAIKGKYNLPSRYALSVGTIEERKNTLLLIEALALVPEKDRVAIVIMGRATKYKEKLTEAIAKYNLGSWVYFLHDVLFTDFPAIYQGALIFLYPSRFEGFGIPLVEAIQSGVPVITSTGSCFKEAAGPGSIYVNPDDASALAQQLHVLSHSGSLREKMVVESRAFITKFKPDVIASDILKMYRDLI